MWSNFFALFFIRPPYVLFTQICQSLNNPLMLFLVRPITSFKTYLWLSFVSYSFPKNCSNTINWCFVGIWDLFWAPITFSKNITVFNCSGYLIQCLMCYSVFPLELIIIQPMRALIGLMQIYLKLLHQGLPPLSFCNIEWHFKSI